ncbi:twin-arginine translocase TatA/TatE family subunit [Knoellia koreensis]|uniref:Preprotein translocase subunit TatA n=1 Tax=Knoellia koreensis TaxID=2730921 RepID=A0A849H843_9MICO|nr:preprotein translocase subunit TatA [Knoellia sp. DB2414S]
MLDVNGWEFILLIVIAVVVLGPERLPEYAAKLGRLVRQVRGMAEGAKGQLREQMGPEFDDIDWRQYDPRQYDPRRIVREALLDPNPVEGNGSAALAGGAGAAAAAGASASRGSIGRDPALPTPFDDDAT